MMIWAESLPRARGLQYNMSWQSYMCPALLRPITLMWLCWQTSASSEPVTSPVTPPALVPPRNSSALEAPLSQLHTDSRDSRNLVLHSNSGITNATLDISLSSLVPVPVPVPVPCSDIAFLCFPSCTHCFPVFQSVFRYVPVPNGYVLWLIYIDPPCTILDMFKYRLWLLFSLSTPPLVTSNIHPTPVIQFLLTGIPLTLDFHILEIIGFHNPNSSLLEIPLYSEFHQFKLLLACFILNPTLTSIQATLSSD